MTPRRRSWANSARPSSPCFESLSRTTTQRVRAGVAKALAQMGNFARILGRFAPPGIVIATTTDFVSATLDLDEALNDTDANVRDQSPMECTRSKSNHPRDGTKTSWGRERPFGVPAGTS